MNFLADTYGDRINLPNRKKVKKTKKQDGSFLEEEIDQNDLIGSFKTGFGKKRYNDVFDSKNKAPANAPEDLFDYLSLNKEDADSYYQKLTPSTYNSDVEGMDGKVLFSKDRSIVINNTVAALLNTKLITNYGISLFQLVPIKPAAVYLYNKYIGDQTVKKIEDRIRSTSIVNKSLYAENRLVQKRTKFFSKFYDFLRNYHFVLESLMDKLGYDVPKGKKKDKANKVKQTRENVEISNQLLLLLKNRLEDAMRQSFENTEYVPKAKDGEVVVTDANMKNTQRKKKSFPAKIFREKSQEYLDNLQLLFKKTYEELTDLIEKFQKDMNFDEHYETHKNTNREGVKLKFKTEALIKKIGDTQMERTPEHKQIENQIKELRSENAKLILGNKNKARTADVQGRIDSNNADIKNLNQKLRNMIPKETQMKRQNESKVSAFVETAIQNIKRTYIDRGQTKLSEHYYSILDNMHLNIKDILDSKISNKEKHQGNTFKNSFFRNIVSSIAKYLWGFAYKSTRNEIEENRKVRNSDYSSSVTINPIARELYRETTNTMHRYIHLPGSYEALLNLNFGVLMVRPVKPVTYVVGEKKYTTTDKGKKKLVRTAENTKEKIQTKRVIAFSGAMLDLFKSQKPDYYARNAGFKSPSDYDSKPSNTEYHISSVISAGIIPMMLNVPMTDMMFSGKKECVGLNSMSQIFENLGVFDEMKKAISAKTEKEEQKEMAQKIAKKKASLKNNKLTEEQKQRIQDQIGRLEQKMAKKTTQTSRQRKEQNIAMEQKKIKSKQDSGKTIELVRYYIKNILKYEVKKSIAMSTYQTIKEHVDKPTVSNINRKGKETNKKQCSYYSIRFFRDLYRSVAKNSKKFAVKTETKVVTSKKPVNPDELINKQMDKLKNKLLKNEQKPKDIKSYQNQIRNNLKSSLKGDEKVSEVRKAISDEISSFFQSLGMKNPMEITKKKAGKKTAKKAGKKAGKKTSTKTAPSKTQKMIVEDVMDKLKGLNYDDSTI